MTTNVFPTSQRTRVPHKDHWEIIILYWENHIKRSVRPISEYINLTAGGTYNYHYNLNG